MKILSHLLLAAATALILASCAETGGGGGSTPAAATQLGPHGAQKFVLVTHTGARQLNENDPNFARTLALVIRIDQQMVGGKQEVTATASAHKDGPNGALIAVDGLRVRILEPFQSASEPRKTAGVHVTNSIPAPGGKFKTATAEASFNSPDYSSGVVSVTVPGDQ
jgi:hypothetical protein